MKANCWYGAHEVRVDDVPDPKILNPRDAILKITSTAICGSDLHLYDGYIPAMMKGDILGHEFMGEVVEVGRDVKNLKVGDRVVNPFPIACGRCYFCQESLFSLCENSNPNAWMAEKLWGHSTAGFFGYSHLVGGSAEDRRARAGRHPAALSPPQRHRARGPRHTEVPAARRRAACRPSHIARSSASASVRGCDRNGEWPASSSIVRSVRGANSERCRSGGIAPSRAHTM
jgi:hypothetical protein